MNYINGFAFTIGLILAIGSSHARLQENHLRIKWEKIGSDLKLSCHAEGQDESAVLNMEWIGPSGIHVGKGPVLNLKNAQPNQFGNYTCRSYLKKDSGLVKWEIRTLVVDNTFEHFETSSVSHSQTTLNFYENQSLDIFCENADSKETGKQSHWVKSDGSMVSANDRLYIESLVQNRDQGRYICMTKQADKSDKAVSKIINLKIKGN